MESDLFAEIVKRASLERVRPTVMRARRGAATSEVSGQIVLVEGGRHSLEDDGELLTVEFEYTVKQEGQEDQAAADCLEASVTFEIIYRFDPPLTDEHEPAVQRFAIENGRFNSWAFLRSYLARVTGEFQIPAIELPLLKPHAHKNKDPQPRQLAIDNGATKMIEG